MPDFNDLHVAPAKILEQVLRAEGVPTVLSVADAARVADKSPAVLARLARTGVLRASRTASKVGRGHWRVTRLALAEYLSGDAEEVSR